MDRDTRTPHDSRIECRELDGRLEVHLPPNLRGAWIRIAVMLAVGVGFPFLVAQYGDIFDLFVMLPMGLFLTVAATLVFFGEVSPQLINTWVTITPDRLVLKTVHYGREKMREFKLHKTSRAQKCTSLGRRDDYGRRASRVQGIDVTCKAGPAYFGKGLPRKEVDWLVRRINRFLGQAKDDDAPEPAGR